MKVIREVITQGVTPPSLIEFSSQDLSESQRRRGSDFFTLMEKTQGSWIVGSPHAPTWLHPLSDHSIELCKIEWSCFG
jgi:hypothetical protein